jgi:hypothetical protein
MRAETIKIQNLTQRLGNLADHTLPAALGVAGATSHLLLVMLALLVTARMLQKAMTIELSEREACVFWGMIQASRRDHIAQTSDIVRHTNEEIERYQLALAPLSEAQIRNSLSKLAELKVIASIPDKTEKWRIIEGFTIRG